MTIVVKDGNGNPQTVQTINDLAADGGQTTIGTTTDAAYAGSGGSSLVAALKGIYAKLAGTVAVTGTFFQATQPVSGAAGSLASGAAVDGWDLTQGTKADTAYAGSGSASVIAALKGLYAQLIVATPAGTNLIGKVGIDQTTPGSTNRVAAAATETWKAGTLQGLTWGTSGFSTEVNSLVNGNAVLAGSAINNATALDEFIDLSMSLGSITPGSGSPYIGVYLVPLNQDGTTYGDGRFASSAAGPPASQYFVGSVPCIPSTAGTVIGMIRGILLPPGSFKLILYNQAGATLAASANTIQIRSYNRAVA